MSNIIDRFLKFKQRCYEIKTTYKFRILNIFLWSSLNIYGVIVVAILLNNTIHVESCPSFCYTFASSIDCSDYTDSFISCINLSNSEGIQVNSVLASFIYLLTIIMILRFIKLQRIHYSVEHLDQFADFEMYPNIIISIFELVMAIYQTKFVTNNCSTCASNVYGDLCGATLSEIQGCQYPISNLGITVITIFGLKLLYYLISMSITFQVYQFIDVIKYIFLLETIPIKIDDTNTRPSKSILMENDDVVKSSTVLSLNPNGKPEPNETSKTSSLQIDNILF
jgi:hypothetical protein